MRNLHHKGMQNFVSSGKKKIIGQTITLDGLIKDGSIVPIELSLSSWEEDSNKSELVNDLIRQARYQQKEIDLIRMKLRKAEKSGFTSDSKKDILAESKSLLNG